MFGFTGRTLDWTDSSTVLCWIQNQRPWKQYVMRRVEEIRNLTQALNWNHCPGEWNPADLATRGIPAIKLKAGFHSGK